MSTEVAIIINSNKFVGWTSVSIKRSMETMVNTFSVGLLDVWEGSDAYGIQPMDLCKVKIGDEVVLTGYVDSFLPSINGEEYGITMRGRCKCRDLVDCSAMNTPGSWTKPIGLQKLVYELVKPFNLRVYNEAETLGDDLKYFSIDSGQSVFDAIRQACETRAVLAISNTDGDVVLTNSGINRSFDSLAYGYNVLKAGANYDFSDRFSEYTVKGSSSSGGSGWSKSTVGVVGVATDPAIKTYRPKLFIADSSITSKLANTRAAWEAQIRAARSGEITVMVSGWRQSNGALWKENELVLVDIAPLRINQAELLITQVSYSLNDSGELTVLTLKRRDAFAAEPPKKVQRPKRKKKSAWD